MRYYAASSGNSSCRRFGTKKSVRNHHFWLRNNPDKRSSGQLAKNSITNMDHPSYLPDFAPCDFWLFQKLKNALKVQRFADLSDIQRNVKTSLRGIPETDFQDCFRKRHHRLTKCIAAQGEYFEGDSSR